MIRDNMFCEEDLDFLKSRNFDVKCNSACLNLGESTVHVEKFGDDYHCEMICETGSSNVKVLSSSKMREFVGLFSK